MLRARNPGSLTALGMVSSFAMLGAGGAKHHKELLAPFGLDAGNPTFWNKGLGLIASMIDELEAMEA